MSKAITILNGLISTAFKKDARKFSEKLAKTEEEDFNEQEFLAELLAADSERIKNLKENVRSDVSKEAKHVLFTEYENKLKSFFNVESDKKGDDLLAQIKEATTGEKTPKELTDEAVKKHPLYLQLEANTKTELQKAKTDYEKALSDKDQEYQQKDITERAVKAGMAMFDSLNPILSTDTVKAQNQRSLFEQQLRNNKYQFVEGQDDPIVLKPDGNRLEDGHGNIVTYSDYVKGEAGKIFDFKQAEARQAATVGGNGGAGGTSGGTNYSGPIPKTRDEFITLINDPKVPFADKLEVKKRVPEEFLNI